jgi:hypothetical protein
MSRSTRFNTSYEHLSRFKTGKVFNEFFVMCGRPNLCEAPEDDAQEASKRIEWDIKKKCYKVSLIIGDKYILNNDTRWKQD